MLRFQPNIRDYDPWLPASTAAAYGVKLAILDEALTQSRCLFVAAAPISPNYNLLNAERLTLLKSNALLIMLSRAHLVDFAALDAEPASRRIRACIDVFTVESVAKDAPIRKARSAILSPHRAAAVNEERLKGPGRD